MKLMKQILEKKRHSSSKYKNSTFNATKSLTRRVNASSTLNIVESSNIQFNHKLNLEQY
jgi:hypothetical protein